jgi:hypothetical protein
VDFPKAAERRRAPKRQSEPLKREATRRLSKSAAAATHSKTQARFGAALEAAAIWFFGWAGYFPVFKPTC